MDGNKTPFMKQIFFLAVAGLLGFCTSCSDAPLAPADDNKAMEQKNLAASDVVMKAFQTGDPTGLDSVIADDFVDHGERGDTKGVDTLKSMVKFVHTTFPDMKFEKVRDVVDSDYVYSWISSSGTGDGTMGLPKGPYKMSTIEISRFIDGKAVEHWTFMDMRDMVKMMPQPAMSDMKMDTARMKK